MTSSQFLPCDGCGQPASPAHIAKRLQRLEWTTRYRPVHINTLVLGASAPALEAEFLYSPAGNFQGEAALLLKAAALSTGGKPADLVHTEFQRAGFMLTHVLECPIEDSLLALPELLVQRLATVLVRIRRSLKPKRLVLISQALGPLISQFSKAELPCSIVLDSGQPFALDGLDSAAALIRLHDALGAAAVFSAKQK
ncbi:MAG TPA: hypothetical protein VOA64_20780 [Candidatus Dormibacteraeota bacterium]|nr:hypothetical protein [Candidatus Dormibacteraeota bacterium]